MTTTDWLSEPYFDEEAEADSLDGGTTSHGPLWHMTSPRWGHSMHSMCSYHGMFPAKLVHYFIERFSQPNDLVLDPFSGRGTTALQARVEGRRTIANDLNPLAYVLSRAKASPPTWHPMNQFIDSEERAYRRHSTSDVHVPDDIRMLFHENTLRQLVFLRDRLQRKPISRWSHEESMLGGAIAGILHGGHRANGTSRYLSISMPNTFSMSPAYVRKYIADNALVPPDQNVFECVREKVARLYLDSVEGPVGRVFRADAAQLLNGRTVAASSVHLVVTSPPYLRVMNYGTANWIRLWWLGLGEVGRNQGAGRRALDAKLDHQHRYETYAEFMQRTLRGARRVLRKDGVAVFVVGDVASPNGDALPLARAVWDDIGPTTGLRLLDVIEDSLPTQSKVSRIWGDTRGRATERDCVLVLCRSDGEPRTDIEPVEWDEPYKDAGPDAAHSRLGR